jgi:hypothetical protein
MLNYLEFVKEIDKAIDVGGCICYECSFCKDRWYLYEGDLKYSYNERYIPGCQKCKKGEFIIFGYKGRGF